MVIYPHILLVFNYIFSTVLEFINNKNWKDLIPNELKNYYSKEKYLEARNYKKEHGKISFISSTLSTIITLSLNFIIFIQMFYIKSNYFFFNKLTPLQEGSLKNKINEYSCYF